MGARGRSGRGPPSAWEGGGRTPRGGGGGHFRGGARGMQLLTVGLFYASDDCILALLGLVVIHHSVTKLCRARILVWLYLGPLKDRAI